MRSALIRHLGDIRRSFNQLDRIASECLAQQVRRLHALRAMAPDERAAHRQEEAEIVHCLHETWRWLHLLAGAIARAERDARRDSAA
jgi:hypothetical protein